MFRGGDSYHQVYSVAATIEINPMYRCCQVQLRLPVDVTLSDGIRHVWTMFQTCRYRGSG